VKSCVFPAWRTSWLNTFEEPLAPDEVRFLGDEARERLRACAEAGAVPLLADILVSRLVATLSKTDFDS